MEVPKYTKDIGAQKLVKYTITRVCFKVPVTKSNFLNYIFYKI